MYQQRQGRRLARDRRVLVICPACGRRIERTARHQIFCSPECRKSTFQEKGRCLTPKTENKTLYGPPIQKCGTKPLKNINPINHLQKRIFGPRHVLEVEVFAGRAWREVVSSGGVVVSHVAQLRPPALRRAP